MWSARVHEAERMCLNVKHILTNEGECKGWNPMIPNAFVQKFQMFRTLVGKINKHQIGPLGHH